MKYDSHGTWESNNYHGLGWQAKHGDRGFRPAGEYEKGYRARRAGETDAEYEERVAAEEPLPVESDGVTANSEGIARRVISYPTPTAQDSDKRRSKMPPPKVHYTASGLPEADRPSGKGAQLTLAQAAHIKDGVARQKLYPTPMTGGMESGGGSSSKRKFVLLDAMRVEQEARSRDLPTPTSQNGLRGGSQSEHHPGKWQSPGHPEYGELNPEWVEWIMGWCRGWTSTEPLAPGALDAWLNGNLASANGRGEWWQADPSDDPAAGVPKTVAAGDKEQEAARASRIAALGNGQVSAVVAAVWTHLWELEMPVGEGD